MNLFVTYIKKPAPGAVKGSTLVAYFTAVSWNNLPNIIGWRELYSGREQTVLLQLVLLLLQQ